MITTPLRVAVLLSASGSQTAEFVAAALQISRYAAFRALHSLADDGLADDEHVGRNVYWKLTDAGLEQLRTLRGSLPAAE